MIPTLLFLQGGGVGHVGNDAALGGQMRRIHEAAFSSNGVQHADCTWYLQGLDELVGWC